MKVQNTQWTVKGTSDAAQSMRTEAAHYKENTHPASPESGDNPVSTNPKSLGTHLTKGVGLFASWNAAAIGQNLCDGEDSH
jgi:hypothetical protein